MKLVSILNEDLVFDHLPGNAGREALYRQMLHAAIENSDDELPIDPDQVVNTLMEREDACAMPYSGVALPHARLDAINDLFIIVGLLDHPVRLRPDDPEPCRIIFMSLISESTSDIYLKAVAALSRHLLNPTQKAALLGAADSREDFLNYLNTANVTMKKVITAEDVMNAHLTPVRVEDKLATALDIFNTTRIMLLPVVDDAGKLIGSLSAVDVVKKFIPDYIYMMDNLNFLNNFEMFNQIFKEENHHAVRDYMSDSVATVSPETPLIQITIRLTRGETPVFFVVDSEQKLLGKIAINDIIHKVLRG